MTVLYYLVPNSPESKLLLYNGVGLLAVILIFFGVKRNQVVHKAPWMWIAAGLASFLIADVIYYVLELLFGARKQIFITFGVWVLVEVYEEPVTGVAGLMMTASVIGLAFRPLAAEKLPGIPGATALSPEQPTMATRARMEDRMRTEILNTMKTPGWSQLCAQIQTDTCGKEPVQPSKFTPMLQKNTKIVK